MSQKIKHKQFIIPTILLGGIYIIFKFNQSACQSCDTNQMKIIRSCSPVSSAYTVIYRRLNCFFDQYQDWKDITILIRSLNYYRDIYDKKYPKNIFGTKNTPCSDDELQVDTFDDNKVFLYIEQDTTKTTYDGSLKKIIINDMVTYNTGIINIGKENRIVTPHSKKTTIQYHLDYDELNSQALITFQQAIHHDSTYQKKFKNVEYQLVNKETRKHEASIRYEDFGERFYLDIR